MADSLGMVTLGRKLKILRKQQKLTQGALGKRLGISASMVSFLERGINRLSPAQLEAIQREFGKPLEEITDNSPSADDPLISQRFYHDDLTFFAAQQAYLTAHRWSHDIWMLNPNKAPMLRSNEAIDSWVENLTEGVTYRTFWVIDHTEIRDLATFVEKAKRVSAQAQVTFQSTSSGVIEVFPFIYKMPASTEHLELSRRKEIWDSFRRLSLEWTGQSESKFLKAHPPTNLDKRDDPPWAGDEVGEEQQKLKVEKQFTDLLSAYIFRGAAIVVYVPKKDHVGYLATKAVMEFDETSTFSSVAGKHGYVVLGAGESDALRQKLKNFELSLSCHLKKETPVPRGQKTGKHTARA